MVTGAFSFMWGADVVVVIKMGAYIHGVLFSMGAYYPDFTVCPTLHKLRLLTASCCTLWQLLEGIDRYPYKVVNWFH